MPIPTTQQPNPAFGKIRNLLASQLGPGSRIFEELAKFSYDYTYWKEDFLGTTAAEGIGASKVFVYTESAAGPVDPAKTAPTAALTSYVTLDNGVTDPSNADVATQAIFCAKWNPFCEVRFQEDTTYADGTIEMFYGFVAALAASAGDILGDIDTPTFAGGVTDAAGIGFDTDQTLKTGALVTIGTSTAVGKTTIPTGLGAPFTQPTLNVDVTYRVELRCPTPDSTPSDVYLFINNALVVTRLASGPDAEKLMVNVFASGNRGTQVVYKLDYLSFGQEKNGAPF